MQSRETWLNVFLHHTSPPPKKKNVQFFWHGQRDRQTDRDRVREADTERKRQRQTCRDKER